MDVTPKVIIFGVEQEHGYIPRLKQFLFKYGLRNSIVASEPADISKYMFENFWPIIFIDHTDGLNDGFAVFEGLYKTIGYQLLSFVFLAPTEKKIYETYFESVGAAGIIRKPLQVVETERLLQRLIPDPKDQVANLALQISRIMLKGDFERAIPALTRLSSVEKYNRGAEIALVRCEISLGYFSKADDRLRRLLKDNPRGIRILCELSDFLKKKSQYQSSQRCYQLIREIHPQMTIKIWDQIMMHFELDQLDEAAVLLESLQNDLTFKELSTEGLARMMFFIGASENIPQLIKPFPSLLRQYGSFIGNGGKIPL